MYLPEKFKGSGWERIVSQHPLATVISLGGGEVSHLPLLADARGGQVSLLGHLARANPHAKTLEGSDCLAIFHGPEAYISPLWYRECDVPTWNYMVVHFKGKARLLPAEETIPALRKLSLAMEGNEGWQFRVPSDLEHSLHQAIVAFEIEVQECQVKFKLSQNREEEDRLGVISGLRARAKGEDLAVAGWMESEAKRKVDAGQ